MELIPTCNLLILALNTNINPLVIKKQVMWKPRQFVFLSPFGGCLVLKSECLMSPSEFILLHRILIESLLFITEPFQRVCFNHCVGFNSNYRLFFLCVFFRGSPKLLLYNSAVGFIVIREKVYCIIIRKSLIHFLSVGCKDNLISLPVDPLLLFSSPRLQSRFHQYRAHWREDIREGLYAAGVSASSLNVSAPWGGTYREIEAKLTPLSLFPFMIYNQRNTNSIFTIVLHNWQDNNSHFHTHPT